MATEAAATPPAETTAPISVDEALALAKADAADAIAAEDAEEAEASAVAAKAERGADGKFKAAEPGEKKAEGDAAEPAKPKAKPEEAGPAGSLTKVRRLWADGNIEEAVKIAFGVDASELKLNSKQWTEFNHKARAAKQEARANHEAANQKLQQASQIAQQFVPVIQARQAYAAGDYENAFRLAFGESANDFQRKMIAQIAGGGKDPATDARVARLEAQLHAEQVERARMAQLTEQQRYQQAVETHVKEITDELTESGDDRFERVASKRPFLEKVLAIQREHWNGKHTLPAVEAAELAWDELYGDLLEARSERGGDRSSVAERGRTRVTSERGGSAGSRKTSAKAGTNLRHSQAAEAAPEEEMSGDDLLAHFIRKAKSEQHASG